jgi:hypothetical protein
MGIIATRWKAIIARSGALSINQHIVDLERNYGHAASGSHAAAAAAAALAKFTQTADAAWNGLSAPLTTFENALLARYAAGTHALPLPSLTNVKTIGHVMATSALVAAFELEDSHGREARRILHQAADSVFLANVVDADLGAPIGKAEQLWTDMDAAFATGTTVTAPGATMDGLMSALVEGARVVATETTAYELRHGHRSVAYGGHAEAMGALAGSIAQGLVPTNVSIHLTGLLNQMDARYQVHA